MKSFCFYSSIDSTTKRISFPQNLGSKLPKIEPESAPNRAKIDIHLSKMAPRAPRGALDGPAVWVTPGKDAGRAKAKARMAVLRQGVLKASSLRECNPEHEQRERDPKTRVSEQISCLDCVSHMSPPVDVRPSVTQD